MGGVGQELDEVREAGARLARDMERLASDVRALEPAINGAQAAAREAASQSAALRERVEALSTMRRREPERHAPTGGTSPLVPGPRVEPPARGTSPGDPERVYGAALALFRAREHGQAVLDFLDFIARFPTHPLGANAQYWIGEAYFAQRDYRQALLEFEKVLGHPEPNTSAADSLWKIGLCHAKLSAPGRARATWRRLLREYPDSGAARQARALLAERGG